MLVGEQVCLSSFAAEKFVKLFIVKCKSWVQLPGPCPWWWRPVGLDVHPWIVRFRRCFLFILCQVAVVGGICELDSQVEASLEAVKSRSF